MTIPRIGSKERYDLEAKQAQDHLAQSILAAPHIHSAATLFHANLHHAYAQTDGTYAYPNSREGDMLKQAVAALKEADRTLANLAEIGFRESVKKDDEITALKAEIERLRLQPEPAPQLSIQDETVREWYDAVCKAAETLPRITVIGQTLTVKGYSFVATEYKTWNGGIGRSWDLLGKDGQNLHLSFTEEPVPEFPA